jgi:acyl carrier protein
MELKTIENEMCDLINRFCPFDCDQVLPDQDLKENYGIDSIALVEMLVEIEGVYGITFDSSFLTYEYFSTVERIAKYISEKVNVA